MRAQDAGQPRVIILAGVGSSVGLGAGTDDMADMAPVAHFAAALQSYGYQVTFTNLAANGDIGAQWHDQLMPWINAGNHPDAVISVFGMNDGQAYQYHAGETFPGFSKYLTAFCQYDTTQSADTLLLTSPHPQLELNTWSLPGNTDMYWPEHIPAPVSPEQLIPPASQSVSTDPVTGAPESVRHAQVNQSMRQVAQAQGCGLVDVEPYWFRAVLTYGQEALFAGTEYVHPDDLGYQSSYHAAEDDFVAALVAKVRTKP